MVWTKVNVENLPSYDVWSIWCVREGIDLHGKKLKNAKG